MKHAPVRRTSRSKITYVETISETPMTPEEVERVLRLVGKIIADVHLKEMHAKQVPVTSGNPTLHITTK